MNWSNNQSFFPAHEKDALILDVHITSWIVAVSRFPQAFLDELKTPPYVLLNCLPAHLDRNTPKHILKVEQKWAQIHPNRPFRQRTTYRVDIVENVVGRIEEEASCDSLEE